MMLLRTTRVHLKRIRKIAPKVARAKADFEEESGRRRR